MEAGPGGKAGAAEVGGNLGGRHVKKIIDRLTLTPNLN